MSMQNALGVQYDPSGNPVSGETGATAPTAAVQVAGNDGTNLRALLTDNTGKLLVSFSASDTTATGNLNALNAAVSVATAGQAGAAFDLAAGTLIGTIVPEISYDNTSWEQTYFQDPTTGVTTTSIVFGANNTHQAKSIYVPTGAGFVRVRVSAFTSGTAAITVRASQVTGPVWLSTGPSGSATPPYSTSVAGLNSGNLVTIAVDASGRQIAVGPGAPGAAPVGNPVYVAGTDGANLRALLTDATGATVVVGNVANGSAATGNPVTVAGVDGSGNVRRLLTDTTGRLIKIDERAGTAGLSRTATSTASATILASNASRLGATIVNDSTHLLYIKFGATASATSYTAILAAKGYYELPFDWTGQVDAILDAGSGNAQVTELTP